MRALDVDSAARLLGVSPRSLADRRYRKKLGLPATKIGRRTVFREADLLSVLERGRQQLPPQPEVAA